MDFKSRLAMFETKSKENAKKKEFEATKKQRTFTIVNGGAYAKRNVETKEKEDNSNTNNNKEECKKDEIKKESNIIAQCVINNNVHNDTEQFHMLRRNTERHVKHNMLRNNEGSVKSDISGDEKKEKEVKEEIHDKKEEKNKNEQVNKEKEKISKLDKKEEVVPKQKEVVKDNGNANTGGQMLMGNKSMQDNIKNLLMKFQEKKEAQKVNDHIPKEKVNETKPEKVNESKIEKVKETKPEKVNGIKPVELVHTIEEKYKSINKPNENNNLEKVNESRPKEETKEMTIQQKLQNIFKAPKKMEKPEEHPEQVKQIEQPKQVKPIEQPKQLEQIEQPKQVKPIEQQDNNNYIIENNIKENFNIQPDNTNLIIEERANINFIAQENQIIEQPIHDDNNNEQQINIDVNDAPEQIEIEETKVNDDVTEEIKVENEIYQTEPIEETNLIEEPQMEVISSTIINDNNIQDSDLNNENNHQIDNDNTKTNNIPQPDRHKSISISIHQLDQLKQNAEEQEIWYEKIVTTNPDVLFSSLSSENIEQWKKVLINQTPFESDTISLISNASESKDILNQKIILNDMNRTRKRERVILPSFADQLTVYITYYVKNNGLEYKQGINEIVGAMLLLHYKFSLTFTETFNLIQGFMNKFITNYYRGNEMVALKASMSLVKLLLQYHCPLLYYFFESLEIQPEMYTMNWFMTTYAGKLHLHILYRFWNYLIAENDNLMIHYCVIAFLLMHKDLLMSSDLSLAVVILSQLTLYYEDEVDQLFNIALNIRSKTPYSFKVLANKLELFKENSKNIGELYQRIKPNEFVSLPIYPKEIFHVAYNGLDNITCPNEECNPNYNSTYTPKKKLPCDYCDLHIKKDIKFIFVDLRIFPSKDKKSDSQTIGFLPNMIMIEQEELQLENIHEILLERFNKEKGKYHFVFITSNTDYFKDYEDNFYEFNESVDYMEQNILYPTTKVRNKKLSIHHKTLKLMTSEEKSKLKEYDILRKTIEIFTKQNIQYISFCFGGFSSIHKDSIMYDITLLNHDPHCKLCIKLKKDKHWKSRTKIEKMFQKQHDKEQMSESTVIKAKGQHKKVFMENTTEELIAENKECPTINYNQITQFICYSEHSLFFGFIKDKLESHERKEVMFMIKSKELLIYLFPEIEGEELTKINSIDIEIILSILPLKKMKNAVILKYTLKNENNRTKEEHLLYIDFLAEIESKKFIYAVNQRKRQLIS